MVEENQISKLPEGNHSFSGRENTVFHNNELSFGKDEDGVVHNKKNGNELEVIKEKEDSVVTSNQKIEDKQPTPLFNTVKAIGGNLEKKEESLVKTKPNTSFFSNNVVGGNSTNSSFGGNFFNLAQNQVNDSVGGFNRQTDNTKPSAVMNNSGPLQQ